MSNIIIITYIIIILYSIILYVDRQTYNNYMSGFWKGDTEFCSEAKIDDMVLYLNDNTKTGYLIITKDNEVIENNAFTMKKRILNNMNNLIPFNNIFGNQIMEYEVEFIPENQSEECFWQDSKFIIELSIINGTILLHRDDTLFSKLYKDNTISNKFIEYAQLEENF